jgi:hypothetical protein
MFSLLKQRDESTLFLSHLIPGTNIKQNKKPHGQIGRECVNALWNNSVFSPPQLNNKLEMHAGRPTNSPAPAGRIQTIGC